MNELVFSLDDARPASSLTIAPSRLVIAGWTGRDAAAIEHHIVELEQIGVPRPSSVPLYYRAARSLLTQSPRIEALGDASSGEVEPVLVRASNRWWLTIGSDHTDRRVETYSVAVSKQLCAKPIATRAWAWDEVEARADSLELRSQVFEDGDWVTYQQGTLASIRPLPELAAGLASLLPIEDGLVMFCGTLGARPNARGETIRPAPRMRLELVDAVGGRTLTHEYAIDVLPLVA